MNIYAIINKKFRNSNWKNVVIIQGVYNLKI